MSRRRQNRRAAPHTAAPPVPAIPEHLRNQRRPKPIDPSPFDNEPPSPPSSSRDSKELSLPRNDARDSLLTNLLESLDQLSFSQLHGSGDNESYGWGDEGHGFRNNSARITGAGPSHVVQFPNLGVSSGSILDPVLRSSGELTQPMSSLSSSSSRSERSTRRTGGAGSFVARRMARFDNAAAAISRSSTTASRPLLQNPRLETPIWDSACVGIATPRNGTASTDDGFRSNSSFIFAGSSSVPSPGHAAARAKGNTDTIETLWLLERLPLVVARPDFETVEAAPTPTIPSGPRRLSSGTTHSVITSATLTEDRSRLKTVRSTLSIRRRTSQRSVNSALPSPSKPPRISNTSMGTSDATQRQDVATAVGGPVSASRLMVEVTRDVPQAGQPKEKQGFFRRVFGIGNNAQNSGHGAAASARPSVVAVETDPKAPVSHSSLLGEAASSQQPGNHKNSNNDNKDGSIAAASCSKNQSPITTPALAEGAVATTSTKAVPAASSPSHHVVHKKHSSFFRRRKKSVVTEETPPLPSTAATATSTSQTVSTYNGRSPVPVAPPLAPGVTVAPSLSSVSASQSQPAGSLPPIIIPQPIVTTFSGSSSSTFTTFTGASIKLPHEGINCTNIINPAASNSSALPISHVDTDTNANVNHHSAPKNTGSNKSTLTGFDTHTRDTSTTADSPNGPTCHNTSAGGPASASILRRRTLSTSATSEPSPVSSLRRVLDPYLKSPSTPTATSQPFALRISEPNPPVVRQTLLMKPMSDGAANGDVPPSAALLPQAAAIGEQLAHTQPQISQYLNRPSVMRRATEGSTPPHSLNSPVTITPQTDALRSTDTTLCADSCLMLHDDSDDDDSRTSPGLSPLSTRVPGKKDKRVGARSMGPPSAIPSRAASRDSVGGLRTPALSLRINLFQPREPHEGAIRNSHTRSGDEHLLARDELDASQHELPRLSHTLSLPALRVEGKAMSPRSSVDMNEERCLHDHDAVVGDPTEEDMNRAVQIYNGNEEVVLKDRAASWIGEEGAVHQRTLKAYMSLYDFSNMTILAALRLVCGRLVLRGETQQVDRILVAFSNRWSECNANHGFKSMDVIHTICYSIMLLNTDLHMADIEHKMTRSQFIKNTMGTVVAAIEDSAPFAFDQAESSSAVRPSVDGEKKNFRLSLLPSPRPSSALQDRASMEEAGPLVNNSFEGTRKAWEAQIEHVLKDIYNSIRDEKLPLFGAETSVERHPGSSQTNLSVINVLKRTPSVLSKAPSEGTGSARSRIDSRASSRWNSKSRSRPRPSNGTSSRTSFDDHNSAWSPTGSSSVNWSKHSLGRTHTSGSMDSLGSGFARMDIQHSIGFATALSHALIRDEAASGDSPGVNEADSKVTPILEDDTLELAGPPWVKEGMVTHKHHLESVDRKPKDRNWTDVFAVVQKGCLSLFSFQSQSSTQIGRKIRLRPSRSQNLSTGGRGSGTGNDGKTIVVGGGNWQDSATNLGTYNLKQTLASILPPPGYSRSRPNVWALSLPTGAVHLFQVGTPEICQEFVVSCNYWSARLSTHPLVGGVSNMEFGWSGAVVSAALIAAITEDESESTEKHGSTTRAKSNSLCCTRKLGSCSVSVKHDVEPGSSGSSPIASPTPTATSMPNIEDGAVGPLPSIAPPSFSPPRHRRQGSIQSRSSIRSSIDHAVTRTSVAMSTVNSPGSNAKHPGDRVVISEWTPPQLSMRASTLSEQQQLVSLRDYVSSIEEELERHNKLRAAMMLSFSSCKSGSGSRAVANWERKSSYLLREIVKFRTYVDVLMYAERRKREVYNERRTSEVTSAGRRSFSTTSARCESPLLTERLGGGGGAGGGGITGEEVTILNKLDEEAEADGEDFPQSNSTAVR